MLSTAIPMVFRLYFTTELQVRDCSLRCWMPKRLRQASASLHRTGPVSDGRIPTRIAASKTGPEMFQLLWMGSRSVDSVSSGSPAVDRSHSRAPLPAHALEVSVS
ncbi:hypothetical protein C450_05030 [Halococcus salifodinae DSM 8989]|uniref:Uncharacterized protein n=1 Tax=Halococcus salifodinae DSM 8989 TaxID=1227456 RepID=M0ND72_9EURY|nr:hypothetical protein C450_05030 [Halococcus salifodinae DSM 8989]